MTWHSRILKSVKPGLTTTCLQRPSSRIDNLALYKKTTSDQRPRVKNGRKLQIGLTELTYGNVKKD